MTVGENNALHSLDGLEHITTLGGLILQYCGDVDLSALASLRSVTSDGLRVIATGITDISPLFQIETFAGELSVSSNQALSDCQVQTLAVVVDATCLCSGNLACD